MNIVIERACASDAAQILEYLKQVGGETDNLTFGKEGMPFSVAEEADYIAKMENSHDDIMLTAKQGEKIVGIATLNRLPRRMAHRGDFGVSVLKSHWGEGIGSKLLEEIINFAKSNSFTVIDLQVRSDNIRAIRLYEKYGFAISGTHPAFHRIGNENIPFNFMFLELK